MVMPEHLRAAQGTALAHRQATRALVRDVRETLIRAILADVRAVAATVVEGRMQVTVVIRPWHDVTQVAAAVAQTQGVVDVNHDNHSLVMGFRDFPKNSGQK